MHGTLPWRGLWPLPDGALDQGDRQQTAGLYRGILAIAAIPALAVGFLSPSRVTGLLSPSRVLGFLSLEGPR